MPKIRQQSNTAAQPIQTKTQRRLSITGIELAARKRDVPQLKPTQWLPGVSGNPGGKSKVLTEILAMGHKSSPAVMERLIDAALNHDNPAVWIPAAKEVLNRTFGKPNQQVSVIGDVQHRHFVLRAPPVLGTSEQWEQEYGEVIEHQSIEGNSTPSDDS